MKNKKIPIVIITSLKDDEYKKNWGLKKKGSWILRENKSYILEFEELDNVYGNYDRETGWQPFVEKISFKIPDKEIIALVLDGNTGDKSPHQFDILWHLLFIENYKIGHVLIHTGFGYDSKDIRLLNKPGGVAIDYDNNENVIKFKSPKEDAKVINRLEYSRVKKSRLQEWIKVISEAVKVGNLSCAVKRIEELTGLLDANDIKRFNATSPKPCYVYEMISWLPNLFLDLLIDSKGLWEIVDGSSSPTERRAKSAEVRSYLEEIIKDKSTEHLRQKLADARYLAFGKTYGNGKLNCNGDKTGGSVTEKSSAYLGENFENENLNEMLKRSDLKDTRKKLAGYLGLKENNLEEDPDDPILKFLCAWDCLIEKGLEHVDDDNIFSIVDFHQQFSDWYDQLVEISDRLKKQIR
jgi:hypothetical protein